MTDRPMDDVMEGQVPEVPGPAIEDLTAVVRGVVHPFGLDQQARGLLELAIRGEGHPKGVEVEGGGRGHEVSKPWLERG